MSFALLRNLVWKEWRDHRTSLLAYFIGLPPLLTWGIGVIPGGFGKDPMLPSCAAMGGLAIAALTLFADVFSGEEQRGTLRFLQRLPGGLLPVYLAKLAFVLLMAIAMSGYAYLGSMVASVLLRGGQAWPGLVQPGFNGLELLFPIAAWIFVVSIWLPRGTLAAPAAVLVLALLLAPCAVMFWVYPGMELHGPELVALYVGVIAIAPFVAGISFVRGRRRGRGPLAAATIGLVTSVALLTPAYGWTAHRVAEFLCVDPSLVTFRMDPAIAVVSRDVRHLVVGAYHDLENDARVSWGYSPGDGDTPLHALFIDLDDGSWREIGPPAATLHVPGLDARGSAATAAFVAIVAPTVSAAVSSNAADHDPCSERRSPKIDWFDLSNGERCDATVTDELLAARGRLGGELQRSTNAIHLPDGRLVWLQDGGLVTDDGVGGVRQLPDSACRQQYPCYTALDRGFGALLDHWTIYDALRERRYSLPESLDVYWVRSPSWIAYSLERTPIVQRYICFDPETSSRTPIAGLRERETICELVADGRLLVVGSGTVVKGGVRPYAEPRGESESGPGVVLLDPESGARTSLAIPGWPGGRCCRMREVGRTPVGAQLLEMESASIRKAWSACIGRLDLAQATITLLPNAGNRERMLLAAIDETTLLVLEERRRVLRVHLDRPDVELLFPR